MRVVKKGNAWLAMETFNFFTDLAEKETMKTYLFILAGTIIFAVTANAQNSAMRDAQEFLSSPAKRRELIQKNPQAQQVDSKVDSMANTPEEKEELYNTAGQILQIIQQQAQGDPARMQRLLQEAQQNPEEFHRKYLAPRRDKASSY